jgi:hypothetical protein
MGKRRRMKRVGHVEHIGEIRTAYRISAGESEEKQTISRPR